jgi:hypothetical protein
MKLSNFTVNLAILSRRSSNPKLMLGRESAIEGASADESGARITLVESRGSNVAGIFAPGSILRTFPTVFGYSKMNVGFVSIAVFSVVSARGNDGW